MGDHEDREGVLLPEAVDEVVHVLPDAGIERAEGLVEEQDLGLLHEGLRNRKALLHASGELRGVAVHGVREADLGDHRLRLLRNLPPRRAEHPREEPGLLELPSDHDVLEDREVREHAVALEDDAAVFIRLGAYRLSLEEELPAGRLLGPEDELQERALAASRGADDGDELALPDLRVDLLEDHGVAVLLPEAPRLEDGLLGRILLRLLCLLCAVLCHHLPPL